MAAGELKSVLSHLPAFDHCVVSAALRKDAETEVPSHQQQVGWWLVEGSSLLCC